jgi:hypothetical protein
MWEVIDGGGHNWAIGDFDQPLGPGNPKTIGPVRRKGHNNYDEATEKARLNNIRDYGRNVKMAGQFVYSPKDEYLGQVLLWEVDLESKKAVQVTTKGVDTLSTYFVRAESDAVAMEVALHIAKKKHPEVWGRICELGEN